MILSYESETFHKVILANLTEVLIDNESKDREEKNKSILHGGYFKGPRLLYYLRIIHNKVK